MKTPIPPPNLQSMPLESWQPEQLLMLGIGLAMLCGIIAFLARKHSWMPGFFGSTGIVCAAFLAVPATLAGFANAQLIEGFTLPWQMPLGRIAVGMDALSAIFMVPLLLLGPLAAIHSLGYMKGHGNQESKGVYWLFFNMLFSSMMLILAACDGILFLIAWELMGISSFALVAFDHKEEKTRSAAWKYLIAAHIGAALLMAMFILLGTNEESVDFSFTSMIAPNRDAMVEFAIFVLALGGFGLKAGIFPLHSWLPDAHPAAPAPVSALMSGIMIKLGIYGILRVVSLLDSVSTGLGWVLITAGAITGVFGVIAALSQSDLKRLLAYSSVENIGIISLGLGLGLYGSSCEQPGIALLGFVGAFLHIFNHAIMKGLLFLSAGSVMKGTGTLDMDKLGGLMKRMPWTGSCFLVGAASIAGLPPFIGFFGEFLILLAGIEGVMTGVSVMAIPSLVTLAALAAIGGLAPAVFAKATGATFLGEPRSEQAVNAKEATISMNIAQIILAALCLLLGLALPKIASFFIPAIATVCGTTEMEFAKCAVKAFNPLFMIGLTSSLLLALLAGAALMRGRLPRAEVERHGPTWDCGYAKPDAKMQYTGSALIQPLSDLFRGILLPEEKVKRPEGPFPKGSGSFSSSLPDLAERCLYKPLFETVNWLCMKIHPLQSGLLHTYIVIIMAALALMVLWAWLGMGGTVE